MKEIPFNWAMPLGRELEHVASAASSGHLSGDGEFTKQCERFLESESGARRALLTTSCTHALEMAALLLDIQPGDDVIVPSFTFVSTVNAFVLRGARPVFADIRPDTLNLDERQLAGLIGPKTKAIVVVHYAGVGCEMDEILSIAREHGVAVVEDNAHGLFGRYRGRPLGSFGVASTLSFHETKNFTCGEGGALLLNSADMVARAEILREKGTNRSRFFRGEIDKYTWVGLGSSYVPSELLAAFLFGQLELSDRIQAKRSAIYSMYANALASWAERCGATLPCVPPHCDNAYHMFYVRLADLEVRQRFLAHLRERSVHGVFHYLPLHLAPVSAQWNYAKGHCPVTELVSDQLVRLPFFTSLTTSDQQRVIDAVLSFQP